MRTMVPIVATAGLRRAYEAISDLAGEDVADMVVGEPAAKMIKIERGTTVPLMPKAENHIHARIGSTMKHALECVEFKIKDLTAFGALATGAYANIKFNPLLGLDQGTGQGQRVGRKLYLADWTVNAMLKTNPANASIASSAANLDVAVPLSLMVLAIIDKLHNGAADNAGLNTVIYDTTILPSDGFPLRTMGNMKRYQVLGAKLFRFVRPVAVLGTGGTFMTAGWMRAVRWTIKFKKPLTVEFTPTVTTSRAEDILVNYPFLVVSVGDISVGADSISYHLGSRVRYTD